MQINQYTHLTKLPIKTKTMEVHEIQKNISHKLNELFQTQFDKLMRTNLDIHNFNTDLKELIISENTVIFSDSIILFHTFELKIYNDNLIVKCLTPLNKTLLFLNKLIYENYSEIKSIVKEWLITYRQIDSGATLVPYQKLVSLRNLLLTSDVKNHKLDFDTSEVMKIFHPVYKELGLNPNKINFFIEANSDIEKSYVTFKVKIETKIGKITLDAKDVPKTALIEYLTDLYTNNNF